MNNLLNRGVIILHPNFSEKLYLTDRYHILFKKICNKLNWTIEKDVPKDISNYDIIVIFKAPQASNIHYLVNMHKIPKEKKLITYYADVHNPPDPTAARIYQKNMEKVLDRSDLIIYAYKDAFLTRWKQYENKAAWLSHCYAPAERFDDIPHNNNPIFKCALFGTRDPYHYPLRSYIYRLNNSNIENMPTVPYHYDVATSLKNGVILRKVYAQKINQYFCAVTCCSRYKYALAKYFEIPAAGSLLIADSCKDIQELGFKAHENFVEIDKNNVEDIINDICKNPENYENIRKNGRTFIKKFSVEKKVLDFIEILKNKL